MSEENQPYSSEINDLRISLWDYENANGSFPASELRDFAAHVAKHLNRIETEREMFIYWLLQAYEAINRKEYEKGKTLSEISECLTDVLWNVGYDPNTHQAAKELLKRAEATHTDSAVELWKVSVERHPLENADAVESDSSPA